MSRLSRSIVNRHIADEAMYRPDSSTAGAGITQLTDNVIAGPGVGSVPATVVKINGATVPVAGALTPGNLLTVTGAATLAYLPPTFPPGSVPCFNILDFGGHADSGVTDNTPAFVAAFNSAIALGAGIVEVSDDPTFPGGVYAVKSSGGVLTLPAGDAALFGLRSSSGCIQRVRIDAGIGAGNDWLRFSGTLSLFDMRDIAFFSVDDSVAFCSAMIEWVGMRLVVENVVTFKVACADQVYQVIGSTSWMNNCIQAGSQASIGNGQWTFGQVNYASIRNTQFVDSGVTPEANIRIQDPGEDPNLGAWSCSFAIDGCVFGEQAKQSIHVEPITGGERFPYVQINNCDFQPNGTGANVLVPIATATGCIRLVSTGNVKISNCAFNWQQFPMETMVAAFDGGDIEMDACIGVVAVRGSAPVAFPLGVQRIYTDAATKSLKVRNSTYSYIDSQCPDITIERGGEIIRINQDTTSDGAPIQRVVIDDEKFASIIAVAGGGGTGTSPIFVTPGAANCVDSNTTATDGLTDPDMFSSNSKVFATNVAAACRISGQSDLLDACDPAFQGVGPVNSSTTYVAGAGATADDAVLTVTNQGANTHDFEVRTIRRRTWSKWTPGLLMGDAFGAYSRFPPAAIPLIAGWYDHSTMVNGGGLIATWKDRSGQHNDLTAAGAARPVYTAVGNNGLPQADFAGAQSMEATFAVPWLTGGAIWTVGTFTGDNQTHAAVAAAAGVFAGGDWTLWRKAANLEDSLVFGGAEATAAGLITFSTRMGSAYGEGANLWQDGVATATAGPAFMPANVSHLRVGNRQGGGFPLVGSLQLVMIFTQVPPVELVAHIQQWAKSIYATP
jgi:hypothetical protein